MAPGLLYPAMCRTTAIDARRRSPSGPATGERERVRLSPGRRQRNQRFRNPESTTSRSRLEWTRSHPGYAA